MDIIQKLTNLFSQFPTVGQRTAKRFVFYLIKLEKENLTELINSLKDLQENISLCQFCFNPTQADSKLCQICQDSSRNKKIICLVEKETDLISIENTKKHKGIYFILGGLLGFKKTEKDLRIEELQNRLKNPEKFLPAGEAGGIKNTEFSEIIIALNSVPEGRATASLVEKEIREIFPSADFKITYLAKGLPFGGELEYADQETLESAFEGRR